MRDVFTGPAWEAWSLEMAQGITIICKIPNIQSLDNKTYIYIYIYREIVCIYIYVYIYMYIYIYIYNYIYIYIII